MAKLSRENLVHGMVLGCCAVAGLVAGLATTIGPGGLAVALYLPMAIALIGGAVSFRHEWWALVPIAVVAPITVVWIVGTDPNTPTPFYAIAAAVVLFGCAATAAIGAGVAALVAHLDLGHHRHL